MADTRKGFTLIELLIVVVIIGILASIAIPKYAKVKERSYTATMTYDLRNLMTAEESYYAENKLYFGGMTITNGSPYYGYTPTSNVSIIPDVPGGGGWNATATYASTLTSKTCAIKVGTSIDPSGFSSLSDGEPRCQ